MYQFNTSTYRASAVIVRAPMTKRGYRLDAPKPAEWGQLSEELAHSIEKRYLKLYKPLARKLLSIYREELRAREDAADIASKINAAMSGFSIEYAIPGLIKLIEGQFVKLNNFVESDITRQFETVLGIPPKASDNVQLHVMAAREAESTIDKIKYLSDEQKSILKDVIYTGYMRGSDAGVIAKRIQEKISVSSRKAGFIARNQMGNYYATMTKARHEELGIFSYTWRTSQDERVRHTHAIKEGVQFKWSEPPEDTGHPGADYNCRCTAEPIFDDEEIIKAANEAKEKELQQASELSPQEALPSQELPAEAPLEQKKRRGRKPKVAEEASGFPAEEELGRLEVVKSLGGSTGAKLVRDPVTGKQYVQKLGSSPDHIAEEVLTNQLYRVMGVDVPPSTFYENKRMTLAEYIPDLKQMSTGAEIRKAHKGFAADALLANWDVYGLSGDNLLVDSKGKVLRIDAGAGLRFRAQGQPKGAAFDENLGELWSLRDRMNEGHKVFGLAAGEGDSKHRVSYDKILEQMDGILDKRESIIQAIRDAKGITDKEGLIKTMNARLDTMQEFWAQGVDMRADGWSDAYVDGFTKQRAGLRKAKIVDAMPKVLQPKHYGGDEYKGWDELVYTRNDLRELGAKGSLIVVDEKGKPWDDLRGREGIMSKYEKFIQDTIAPSASDSLKAQLSEVHANWAGSQASDSWNREAQGIKHWIAKSRKESGAQHWWREGEDTARRHYREFLNKSIKSDPGGGLSKEEAFDRTMQAFHAFNYEMMNKANMPTKSKDGRFITLIRTENSGQVLSRYGMEKLGAKGEANVIRGPIESTSLFRTFYYKGDAVVATEVPIHRIFCAYFPSRRSYGGDMLLGDHENEAVAIMENSINVTIQTSEGKLSEADYNKVASAFLGKKKVPSMKRK